MDTHEIDTSSPNAARIYDYILGGTHNFEADRQAGEQVIKLIPFISHFVQLQRRSLRDIAYELTQQRGFDVIVDFAAGLPTAEHIHNTVPAGTVVIYADLDPVVVRYAHEILQDTPDVYYFQSDARRPIDLLSRPEVQQVLGERRNIALLHWGVCWTLSDEEIATIARDLYDWSHAQAQWVIDIPFADASPDNAELAQLVAMYHQMGVPMYIRSLESYQELVQPWKTDTNGFVSFVDWHNLDLDQIDEAARQSLSRIGGGYGAYLVKEADAILQESLGGH